MKEFINGLPLPFELYIALALVMIWGIIMLGRDMFKKENKNDNRRKKD